MATFAPIGIASTLVVAASSSGASAAGLGESVDARDRGGDRDVAAVIESPQSLSPPRARLGAALAGRAAAFARARRPSAADARTADARPSPSPWERPSPRSEGRRRDLENRS